MRKLARGPLPLEPVARRDNLALDDKLCSRHLKRRVAEEFRRPALLEKEPSSFQVKRKQGRTPRQARTRLPLTSTHAREAAAEDGSHSVLEKPHKQLHPGVAREAVEAGRGKLQVEGARRADERKHSFLRVRACHPA